MNATTNSYVGRIVKSRYKIKKSLSKGGFGRTYLASDLEIAGQNSLIKVLICNNNPTIFQDAKRKFQQERDILEMFDQKHLNIPKLIDFCEEEGEFFLIQQYIDGKDLKKKFCLNGLKKEGTSYLNETELVDFLNQLLSILTEIHDMELLHRDIKPSNIISCQSSTGSNIYHLIDFGCAKDLKKLIYSQGNIVESLVAGTPGYMPMEQNIQQATFSSDIYALGIVAIQLVTGITNVEFIQFNFDRKFWQSHVSLDSKLVKVLEKMTHPDCRPGNRYQSTRQVLKDLELYQKNHHSATKSTIILPTSHKKFRDNFPRYIRTAIGLLSFGFLFWLTWEMCFKPRIWESSSDMFSIGGKSFLGTGEECTDEVRDKDYSGSLECYERVSSLNLNNPELAIYKNNSEALSNNNKSVFIVASVPISTNPNVAQEMLRGVAHSQQKFNDDHHQEGLSIVIVIADDANNKDNQSKRVARLVQGENQISGFLGSNSTESTKNIIKVLQKGNIPWFMSRIAILSSTSSGIHLNEKLDINEQFFRTVLSDEKIAIHLAAYLEKENIDKLAIFYDATKDHPIGAKTAFVKHWPSSKLLTTDELDVQESSFFQLNQIKNLDQAKKTIMALVESEVEDILLLPAVTDLTSIQALAKAVEVTPGADKLNFYGITPLYNPQSLQNPVAGELKGLLGMTLAIDWHRGMPSASAFIEDFGLVWSSRNSLISWRTATSYDAMQVFGEAISAGNYDRSSILQYLGSDFHLDPEKSSSSGFTLDTKGDRKGVPIFVTLVEGKKGPEFKFKCEKLNECD
ncbi:MAG: bifunctional serine/threonine-protein kinase/ABC transporter substrate-binding protein [Cyanobacteria bacterium P01_G01_bin.49]